MTNSDLQQWVGRTQVETGEATLTPPLLLAAALDLPERITKDSALPPLWHWLYFLPQARRSEIGSDGHPRKGGFLPPISLPRRMWAGSRVEWERDLYVGENLERKSTIESVESKSGRSGHLVFVKVRHEIGAVGGEIAVREWQDIVYREAPSPSPSSSSAPIVSTPQQEMQSSPAWSQRWQPDPVLLFRFSALTYNGHRIHYDRPYATNEEGYPGLVVHGPLLAMLMMQLARSRAPERHLRKFQFRGLSPVTDIGSFDVCGTPLADGTGAELWVRTSAGALATEAKIGFTD